MTQTILAIDPGTTESAYVSACTVACTSYTGRFSPNDEMLDFIRQAPPCDIVAVEMVACYGMPVGREVFETCLVIGRIVEICSRKNQPVKLVYRRDIKGHFCGTSKAKDSNIRQALLDRIGPVGTKKKPGPLYGFSSHKWAALAVAVYAQDMLQAFEDRLSETTTQGTK